MHLAVVLLKDQTCPNGNQIVDALRRKWPELRAAVESEDEGTIAMSTTQGSLILGKMPAPYPWKDLEGPCKEGTLWPKAVEEVQSHTAHLVLTIVAEQPLEPIPYFSLLSRFAAAVMVVCPPALGLYFGHAGLVITREVFIDFTLKVLPLNPPLLMWVRFYTGWESDGQHSGGCTQGLSAFGIAEMECTYAPETPAELAGRFEQLALYILEGARIGEGETFGSSNEERIRVRYMASRFGHDGKVMRLIFE